MRVMLNYVIHFFFFQLMNIDTLSHIISFSKGVGSFKSIHSVSISHALHFLNKKQKEEEKYDSENNNNRLNKRYFEKIYKN